VRHLYDVSFGPLAHSREHGRNLALQQELHNDAVMRDLRETRDQLKQETAAIGRDLHDTTETLTTPAAPPTTSSLELENKPAEKQAE
jgi:hypothetical protein